ncbi:hypothetical protein GY45DRAFT_1278743 [Cubamyces sp. BRFM 1775]|nr:hypothetical protein GY45DRAFT_1278743 [Cubamyces sp. BRFM 1775]
MRVKVESVPPLPHVKAWFSANALPSILDLKNSLCADLQPLSHERVLPEHILLLLDDFELLDSSPIDVVRDGDLIVIKKRPSPPQSKRKAPEAASPSRKRAKLDNGRTVSQTSYVSTKRHASAKPPAPVAIESTSELDSSSDSSSSSESEEDESSDSDTDSDTSDSSSGSDSDSSTSSSSSASSSFSEPETRSSRQKLSNGKKATTAAAKPQTSKPAPPPVPPGYGKPATHSRNLRRRRKKMYERLSLTAEPTSVNDIPLGLRAHTHEPTAAAASASTPASASAEPDTQPVRASGKGKEPAREISNEGPSFMMASLQNKNKKRGFKSAMAQGVPPKIIFPDAASAASTSTPTQQQQQQSMDVDPDVQLVEAALNPSPPTATPAITRVQPRLIPPSEKQERGQIPANMFVTSVDVEEGMWNTKGKKKNKKKKKVQVEETWDYAAEEVVEDGDAFAGGLPYDDVPEVSMVTATRTTSQKDPATSNSTEHAVVAAQWDTLRKITDKAQLQPGATVGWKALGINFATFTPEILLHVGRVLSCDEQLVVEPIAEPGAAGVSFGGAVDPEEGGPAEETFEWSDVFQGDWRLVSVR